MYMYVYFFYLIFHFIKNLWYTIWYNTWYKKIEKWYTTFFELVPHSYFFLFFFFFLSIFFFFFFLILLVVFNFFFSSSFTICTALMLKKGVKQYSLLPKGTSVQCLGGMSYLNVEKRDFLLNQRWVMHCFSGAWSLMLLLIPQVCMVS